jgi:RNA recognition motif-containing protein
MISERVNRERPCRTLFIRNIKYETSSDEVRQKFEDHGDVKTFFDLIANRGMVFVTYVSRGASRRSTCTDMTPQFDLRAAERARERLQGSEVSGRPVSYLRSRSEETS